MSLTNKINGLTLKKAPGKVLIASLLKPADDVRAFQKIGKSLAQLPKVCVVSVGYRPSPGSQQSPKLQLRTLYQRHRLHPLRLLAPLKFAILLLQERPKLVVVNSPDLLGVSSLFKIFFACKSVYDIQEDYLANILYSGAYPPLLSKLLGPLVRAWEKLWAPWQDGFLLAERCYLADLPFIRNRPQLLLENKFQAPSHLPPKSEKPAFDFLYTGTLAPHYGAHLLPGFLAELHKQAPNLSMQILGFSPLKPYKQKFENQLFIPPHLDHDIRSQPIPYHEIVQAIRNARIGLLPYLPNLSTQRRCPTRFFEYSALGLPLLVQQNPHWQHWAENREDLLFIDFRQPEKYVEAILEFMDRLPYIRQPAPEQFLWKNQEASLQQFIGELLKP